MNDMKNHILTAIALFAMAACGQAQQPSDYTISSDGIGTIKLGAEATSLPASCDGLYDRLEVVTAEDDWGDTYEYKTAFSGDKAVCNIYYWDNKVYAIHVVSPALSTENGLTCNSAATEIFDKGGEVEVTNDGTLYVVCDGVRFEVNDLTKQGQDKRARAYYGEDPTFSAADFAANAKASKIYIFE